MSNEITVQKQDGSTALSTGVQLRTFGEMMEFARTVANSGLAPRDLKSPEAILVAMQHGMELGLSPMQAIQSVAVINGRPVIWGDAALALVTSRPDCEDVIETFDRGKGGDEEIVARCEVKRVSRTAVVRTFSVAQAKKANLWGKAGPWTQYPQRMLQCRARSWALRDAFPDALKGVGVVEEVRDTEPRSIQGRVLTTAAILPGDAAPAAPVLPEPETGLPLDPRDADGNFQWEAAEQ